MMKSALRRAWDRRAIAVLMALVIAGLARPAPAAETAPIHFATPLSPEEETSYTESPGTGHAEFTLDRDTLRFSWIVTFQGLTSPMTGAHIHGPQSLGSDAGILFDLGPKGAPSPLKGSLVLTDGQLEYLLSGRMYVNLHTVKYKDGELRGQLKRVREKPAKRD